MNGRAIAGVVTFSHPADFTPVCTTELGLVASLQDEFKKRNVKTIALSVDDAESHKGWIRILTRRKALTSTIQF